MGSSSVVDGLGAAMAACGLVCAVEGRAGRQKRRAGNAEMRTGSAPFVRQECDCLVGRLRRWRKGSRKGRNRKEESDCAVWVGGERDRLLAQTMAEWTTVRPREDGAPDSSVMRT